MHALRLGPVAKGPPGPKPEISPNHGRTQASEGRLPRLRGFQATLGKKEPPRLPPTPPHSLPRPRPPPGPCSQETHTPWPDGSHARSTSEAAPRLPSPGQTARDCNLGTDRAQSTSEAAPRPPRPGRRTLTRECCSKPPSFGMTCCRATDNLDYRMDRDTWGPKPGRGRGRGRGRMRGGSGHAWARQECVAGSRACQGTRRVPRERQDWGRRGSPQRGASGRGVGRFTRARQTRLPRDPAVPWPRPRPDRLFQGGAPGAQRGTVTSGSQHQWACADTCSRLGMAGTGTTPPGPPVDLESRLA